MPRRSTAKSQRVSKVRRKTGVSWKRKRAVRKLVRRVKLASFAFLTVGLTVAVLYLASVIKLIRSSFVSAGFAENVATSSWEGNRSINILLLEEDSEGRPSFLGMLRLNSSAKSYITISLPKDAVFTTKSGSKMTLEKIYEYGNSQEDGKGLENLKSAVLTSLGLPVEKAIIYDETAKAVLYELFGSFDNDKGNGDVKSNHPKFILGFRGNISLLLNHIRTDLSIEEFTRLSLFMADSKYSDNFLVEKSVAEDPERFDFLWRKHVFERGISEEGLKVLVLNASGKPGEASLATRALRNSGLFVLDPGNSYRDYDESFIVTKVPSGETLRSISASLGIPNVIEKLPTSAYGNFADRADILVILGVDTPRDF